MQSLNSGKQRAEPLDTLQKGKARIRLLYTKSATKQLYLYNKKYIHICHI